jgi:hypothetical protein
MKFDCFRFKSKGWLKQSETDAVEHALNIAAVAAKSHKLPPPFSDFGSLT